MIRFFLACLLAATPVVALASPTQPPSANEPKHIFQLSYADAEAAIAGALMEKNAGKKIAATITGIKHEPLFSYGQPITVELRGLTETGPKSWSASLLVHARGEVVTAMPLSGRYEEMVEVPVLKRQLRNGDVIGKSDLEIRDFPVSYTRSDTITDMASLIGKVPERAISALRPIRTHEIVRPTMIEKNAIVQMRYLSPGMEITATGQAIGHGAKGDVIAVRNMASKRVVRGVIADENTITILGSDGTLADAQPLTGATYDN